jgi:two-component system nitrate/nitrite response regulator NarL
MGADSRESGGALGAVGKLQVLIADEHGIFRDALRAALEREPDLEVVGEAAEGPEAVAAVERTRPDVAILSATLATSSGVRASCLIRERAPDCRTIVLADVEDQRQLTDGLGCGASGYLTKGCSLEELVEAVRAVARGETLIPPIMLGPLLSNLLDQRRDHESALLKLGELSPREREVLALVARGAKTTAIAETLVISPETARTHIQNILTKLDIHSRLEAASFVIENGLLEHLNGRGLAAALEHSGNKR